MIAQLGVVAVRPGPLSTALCSEKPSTIMTRADVVNSGACWKPKKPRGHGLKPQFGHTIGTQVPNLDATLERKCTASPNQHPISLASLASRGVEHVIRCVRGGVELVNAAADGQT